MPPQSPQPLQPPRKESQNLHRYWWAAPIASLQLCPANRFAKGTIPVRTKETAGPAGVVRSSFLAVKRSSVPCAARYIDYRVHATPFNHSNYDAVGSRRYFFPLHLGCGTSFFFFFWVEFRRRVVVFGTPREFAVCESEFWKDFRDPAKARAVGWTISLLGALVPIVPASVQCTACSPVQSSATVRVFAELVWSSKVFDSSRSSIWSWRRNFQAANSSCWTVIAVIVTMTNVIAWSDGNYSSEQK